MKETEGKVLKPFDIVSYEEDVGFVEDVISRVHNPTTPENYSVVWVTKKNVVSSKTAWWDREELAYHPNLQLKIVEKDQCTT